MKTCMRIGLFILLVGSFFSTHLVFAETLKIGALYPRSGSLALLGEESWRGAEIARLEKNRQGGINGQTIEFINADGPTPSAARSEAERLIEQKNVGIILGTYSSSRCMAATEVAARKRIPYFELGAIAVPITDRGYSTVYRTCPNASYFSKSQIDFLIDFYSKEIGKKPSELKVSIAHEDSDYGTSVADSFSEYADEKDIPVISIEPYSANSSDLSSVIFRLKQKDPDIVVLVSYAQDAILFSRQAHELQFDTQLFGTGGGHSLSSLVDALGAENVEGVLNVDFTQYEVNKDFTPGLDKFLELYKETFNEPPRSGHSLANYMGANVLFEILEATGGSLDPSKIAKVAEKMDKPQGRTATGWGVKFSDKNQNLRANPLVTQWRDGKLVTVWPEGAAVMEPLVQ
ncbi:MAG: ABC transporter substrate-binding protein [Desulfohalobiaceae bacterium]|nr:ABC transporter substrate-binding protein [Desulfohalobiaceae bacterium]